MDIVRHLVAPSLRYFAAAARHGSFRAAARELNVASSAVTRQIAGLEADLGVALFERVGRRIHLSAAGEVLFERVRDVVRDFEDTGAAIDALVGLRSGRVRIATVESVAGDLLPGILAGFSRLHPNVDVSVTTTGSDEATRLVAEGDAEIAFTFNPPADRRLAVSLERPLAIVAVMAPDHPLAGAGHLGLADCLHHRLAMPAAGLSIRAAIEATAAFRRLSPRLASETNTLDVMRALAREAGCVGFQTRVGLGRDLAAGTLVEKALVDPDLSADRFVVLTRADRPPKMAAAAFHDHAVQALGTILPSDDAGSASDRS